MKSNFTLLFSFVIVQIGMAQIPAGYYNTATGTGYTLKTQLSAIITAGHIDQGYDAFDTFTAVHDLDNYTTYENDGTILDVYSENPNGVDPYNYTPITDECGNYNAEGVCYNKEHVIPQSIFSQNYPMRSDAHHLLPTDGRVNGFRSNYPFGNVGSNLISQSGISNPTLNGSKLGNYVNTGLFAGYSGTVFEPVDEFKGDIARIYFYFITRYESQIANWTYDMFTTTSQGLSNPFLYTLLDWHLNDPVSQKEIDRNNALYNYQGNRNPYVDHPEYVCQIWSSFCTTLGANTFTANTSFGIYPNPSQNGDFNISTKHTLNSITIYNVNGQIVQHIINPTVSNKVYTISNLASGFYWVQLLDGENGIFTTKIIVN